MATKSIFTAIKAALGSATGELSAVRADLARLRARREYLVESPLPFADYCAAVLARVDAQAQQYPELLRRYLVASNAASTKASKAPRLKETLTPLFPIAGIGVGANSPKPGFMVEQAMSYIFAGEIKAKLAEALSACGVAWPADCGPPLAEREKELAELEQQIAAAEAIEREMLAELKAALAVDATRGTPPDEFAGGTPAARVGKAEL
jgi:hypothetical protein